MSNEIRKYKVLDTIREHGRSRVLLECPFCGETFWAYNWSLCGSGKKCTDCGAIHYRMGAEKR